MRIIDFRQGRALRETGAAILWRDPGKPIALWVLPGAEQDRLRIAGLLPSGSAPGRR